MDQICHSADDHGPSILSSCRIVHADVRPDNIMVVHRRQQPIRVRLIDPCLAFQAQKLTSITLEDNPTRRTHRHLQEKKLFLHLPQKMMQVNHEERIKPWEVLQHPFLSASSLCKFSY
ncbi:hypothetical protein D4764_01G0016670 [Takifugu flavidus]|uniref:Protein kinase domain-containing protein n=1 Tax=Takifugu flavidus TaxID=433684 RepID=A0A5C6PPS4_9TELE|nr:hypothetical protein D4764_01G0016670 [Takifugu flavidus]